MSDYDIYIIKGREIKKKRGMLFKDWCVINGFEYMISELDEDYLFNNYGKTLNDLTQGFDKKVRWVCVNNPNHEMFFKPVHRTNGHWNCPYCSGSRLHLSEHSVAIDLKDLVDSEWDYDLNKISPESLTSSSLTKVWWRCRDCGSEFEQSPYKRKIGQGCPYCANLKVEAGINDVFTKRPDLESEWDFDKNDISPYSTPAGSDKKVWWKCYNGHSWYTTITSRANEGHNCPYCSSNSTSFSEKAIYYYTSLFFTDVSWRDRSLGYEYDVFLKDKKILIEFNGYYWHKNKEVIDRIKFQNAINKGYFIIVVNATRDYIKDGKDFIRSCNITDKYCIINCYCEKSKLNSVTNIVRQVLKVIFDRVGLPFNDYNLIDVKKDYDKIISLYKGDNYVQ